MKRLLGSMFLLLSTAALAADDPVAEPALWPCVESVVIARIERVGEMVEYDTEDLVIHPPSYVDIRIRRVLSGVTPPNPAQLAVEMLPGQTVTVGSFVSFKVTSKKPGYLVLMDVVLPGADGVELTQGMKRDPELAAIPVVMVTGEARREILMRSMEAGAVDFIVKPFTPDALVAKLGRFLPALR